MNRSLQARVQSFKHLKKHFFDKTKLSNLGIFLVLTVTEGTLGGEQVCDRRLTGSESCFLRLLGKCRVLWCTHFFWCGNVQ